MCTIGVLRFTDGTYALFKNKDFGRPRFDDRITLERDIFGVTGLATFARDDPDSDEFSGFSIGANSSGLLCCDANVRTVDGHGNYDDLVEIALNGGNTVDTAIPAIGHALLSNPYHWANLVLIDREQAAAIEIRGHRMHVLAHRAPIVRTNHHVTAGPTPGDDNTTTSVPRLAAVERGVRSIDSVEGVRDLLRSHESGGAALCVHGAHQTVYSYVLNHTSTGSTLSVIQDPPCETSIPVVLPIPFGPLWSTAAATDFRRNYPSAAAAPVG